MTLGKRIKAARERLQNPRVTQAAVGAHFGISDKAVSGWERDDTIPELGKIVELSRLLKVPCAWLLDGAGEPPLVTAFEVQVESWTASERAVAASVVESLRKQRDHVA